MMMGENQLLSSRIMKMKKSKSNKSVMVVIIGVLIFSLLAHSSSCAPIQTPDFSSCRRANWGADDPILDCCPPVSKSNPVPFTPPPAPATLRRRPAVQCANFTYGSQLSKAYELMRALPADDPRSLHQQANLHCAYCGGAFLQAGTTNTTDAIDIHYSWLFFPWHRMFLHFHERILQSLLNDTSFSLPYWNWDNQGSFPFSSASCQKAGNLFPQFYNDPKSGAYDPNRNHQHTAVSDAIIDLVYISDQQNGRHYNSTQQVAANLNVMHQVMAGGATTAQTFIGSVYRAGDSRPQFASGGTLELGPHVSAHFWVAETAWPYLDFGTAWLSAFDPLFYAHHANVDRLWSTWTEHGGHNFNDSDWLNASFLFYDEYAQVVQVKISDVLNMSSLGYEYESVDNTWADYVASKCNNLDAQRMLEHFQQIPQPHESTEEGFTLSNGGTFNAVLQRTTVTREKFELIVQNEQQLERGNEDESDEMLVIRGIHFNSTKTVSFDVFLDLPEAGSGTPHSCAEYVGRFNHLPLMQSEDTDRSHRSEFLWQIGITKTLQKLQMDVLPSVLVTLVSSSPSQNSSDLSFRSISIEQAVA